MRDMAGADDSNGGFGFVELEWLEFEMPYVFKAVLLARPLKNNVFAPRKRSTFEEPYALVLQGAAYYRLPKCLSDCAIRLRRHRKFQKKQNSDRGAFFRRCEPELAASQRRDGSHVVA